MRREISIHEWHVLGAMAGVTLGVWLGILRLILWAHS
jgi:hypothetical protein